MPRYINSLPLKARIISAVILMMTAITALASYLGYSLGQSSSNLPTGVTNAGIAVIAGLSLMLYVLLSKLLMPLDILRASAQYIESGEELLPCLPATREDEIGSLIRQFNRAIEERRASEERLEYLAHHDALTGLPNRMLLQSRFPHMLTYAESQAFRVGLLYLNLDNLKSINDSFGYAAGDEVIKAVADRIRECLDGMHAVSRLDGDEFLIALSNVAETADIENALSCLLEKLGQPLLFEGREISTSVSVGVAVFPEDGHDFASLFKKADTAMVQAKESGRNTYRFFDIDMNVDAAERLLLRSHMKRALERDEFVLHYQPQIDLETGMVVGAEALIRWQHPEFGLLPPGAFISIAEDSGLIVPIGEWVLREACRQAAEWRQNGLPELVIAVNLSAAQFRRGNLEQSVVDALADVDLPPECLELELTESILIKDTQNVLQQVRTLKSLGIKLSIDDFGTGYSSLAYLKKFAVDKIKIDQSFVRDLASNPDDAAIVRAIIQIARSLNLRTIAEGVEDGITLTHLRLHHCNEVQGYHFSRPLPAAKFAMFMSVAEQAGHAGGFHMGEEGGRLVAPRDKIHSPRGKLE